MIIKKIITFKTDFIGFHQWVNAPDEVKFLRDLHRHKFYVEVSLEVKENDREKEFFIEQEKLFTYVNNLKNHLNSNPGMSCEHMAEFILTFYINESGSVQVSEDGESSAKIYFNKD